MWVVKLGGSLTFSDNLRSWLRVLADASSVVIVPGGGPFSNQVRRVQNHWGFDDSSAHYMALLAMEQFGTMLCALQTGLVSAATIAELRAVLERGETPIWMPALMVMAESDITHSWGVTSDSLSSWLCGQLGADALLLVKSIPFTRKSLNVEMLMERRIIDSEFGRYLQAVDVPVCLMSEQDFDRCGEVLGGNMDAAMQVIKQPPT